MASTPDPFHWSVEEVVSALCQPSSPWTKDITVLEAKIKDEEIDGKTLLTFEETCSRLELMECLGIRLARHKASLCEKLVNFRASSSAYHAWHMDFRKKTSFESEGGPDAPAEYPSGVNGHGTASSSTANAVPIIEAAQATPINKGEAQGLPKPHLKHSAAKSSGQDEGSRSTGEALVASPNSPSSERPSKRKRVQPTNLSTKPLTESTTQQSGFSWDRQVLDHSSRAYIGDGSLASMDILTPDVPTTSRVLDYADGDFTILPLQQNVPGRRIAVGRTVRRYLRRNGRKEASIRHGEAFRATSPSDEEDKILDLSDLASEWDEDTLREMEDERREVEELRRTEVFLSGDVVQTLLQEELETMAARWRQRKSDSLQRKAWKMWTSARRRGTTTRDIIEARRKLSRYHGRIQALSAEIVGEKWLTEKEVRNQAMSFEQTLADKLHETWVIETLESRMEPPRPPPKTRAPKHVRRPAAAMEEILTSTDEDGEDDFIVPAEEDGVPVFMKASTPAADTSAEAYVDLTMSDPTPNGRSIERAIDLDTPAEPTRPSVEASPTPKPRFSAQPLEEAAKMPKVEELGSLENICSVDRKHWADKQDRWRLVVYMLGKLSFGRRRGILETLKTKSPEEVWETSVVTCLSSPNKPFAEVQESEKETIDFDIVRIFASFVRCKVYRESRMEAMASRTKEKLKTQDAWFSTFCKFACEAESLMPTEDQIFRPELLDYGVALGDEDEEDDQALAQETPSKARAKEREIIRDKAAVTLRKQHEDRTKDYEARRLKLRAAIDNGLVPKDKSRLIINESKDDDQSLIYIHQEIGRSIKDHQIDGVRFMWNEVILDADERQGCLLAHTMGLGKTMQVITLLVAISEASSDPQLKSQIPDDLRVSRTLVLCPAGLVDNWIDEFLKWAPKGSLGTIVQLDSTAKEEERHSIIQHWSQSRGVLVIGYQMFLRLAKNERLEELLCEAPSIVIADEAHSLKNPQGKLNRLVSNFKTSTRIALTGSPLANNVEEYYSMINWIAPNFLGPREEFQEIYARVIQAGLWHDSMAFEKRKALKMLQVLKQTVASKVHRATIKSCMAQDLPQKSEFVISVPPTEMQQALYTLYINTLKQSSQDGGGKMQQSRVFTTVNDLSLICNHPRCFRQKAIEAKKTPQDHPTFPSQVIPEALRLTSGADKMEPSLSFKVQLLIMILDEARNCGDKVLVFSQSLYALDYLKSLLELQKRRVCRLDGSTTINRRQDMIKDFNTGRQEVYLISTTAGGVGLNIQGANRVVIFDSRWNPVNDQQAVGRAYRMGQTKPVFVYHFMVAGSFEEAMQSKAIFKTQLASRVVDKKNPISWGKRSASVTEHLQPIANEDLSCFIGKDAILDRLINHPPSGSRIKKIVSTDTFEEEDVNTNLTPEESREAEDLIKMNKLRGSNPREYERLRDEQSRRQMDQASSTPVLNATGIYQSRHLSSFSQPVRPAPPPIQGQTPVPVNLTTVQTNPYARNGYHGQEKNLPSAHHAAPSVPQAGQPPPQVGAQGNNQPANGDANASPRTWHIQHTNNTAALPSSAPIPMTGANTFFGNQAQTWTGLPQAQPQTTSQHTQPWTAPQRAAPPPYTPTFAGTSTSMNQNLFSISQSTEKKDFETKLAQMLSRMQDYGCTGVEGQPRELASSITESVHKIRQEKSEGFLPDNLQWRRLRDMIDQERFIRATIAGFLSPAFLAEASESFLQQRIKMLNGLSEEDFMSRIGKKSREQDPENLRNVQKKKPLPGSSSQATEDQKAMREAADNKAHRRIRLPSWAAENLPASQETSIWKTKPTR